MQQLAARPHMCRSWYESQTSLPKQVVGMRQYVYERSQNMFTIPMVTELRMQSIQNLKSETYNVGEITAKLVAKAFWKEEVNQELSDLGIDEKWTFVPNAAGCLSGTYDDAMEYANKHRSHSIYSHDCSDLCKKKVCVALYVADGNWKLRYAHCMWKVPVVIEGFGKINYPSVCPLTPVRGKAFCDAHVKVAEKQQIKTDLREFLKSCGSNENDCCETDSTYVVYYLYV
ncbi:Hypothetical predicted protein [Paramuricea clavata]|uniref:Uncharacterized protein n=1 Tax=Paramuricea clavata TaxID=317549 RepID=A0A6S7HCT4_PARCT|nr:Hypothetical predicted protein [Paramuricea clavata]